DFAPDLVRAGNHRLSLGVLPVDARRPDLHRYARGRRCGRAGGEAACACGRAPRPEDPDRLRRRMEEFMQAPADRPHFRYWPARAPHGIPRAQTTLWDNLAITARRYPDRDAFVFLGARITWAEVHRQADALAGWLVEAAGVEPGDRVLLCLQNSPQYAIAFYAILRARAVAVPVNPMTRADELPHYVEDPQARVAIVAADLLPEFVRAQE